MGSHQFAFAAVAVVCVAATGAGRYLATRQNVSGIAAPTAATAEAATDEHTREATPLTASTAVVAAAPPKNPPTSNAAGADKTASSREPRRADRVARAPQPAPPRLERADHDAGRQVSDRALPAEPAPTTPATHTEPQPLTPTDDVPPFESARAAEPPARRFDELVISSDSVIGLQMEGLISSERARVEDRVEARVSRDVRVNGETAIPAGTRALGNVVLVERGGRVRERARLGIRFHTLQLTDGTRLPITTEAIYRLGDAPSNGSAAKIGGGAVAGAILGAIIGGGKGAAIGATTGAGAGTAVVMTGERSAAVFPAGTDVTARILAPVTVTVERQ